MSLPSVCLCLNQLCEFLWLVPLLVFHPFFQSLSLSPSCSFVFPRSLSSAFPLFVCHVPQFPILWKSGVSMFGMLPLWHHVYSCQCVPRVFSLPHYPSVFLCQLLPWSCVAISLIFVRFPVCLFVSFVHIHFRFSLYFLWSGNKALFELLLPPWVCIWDLSCLLHSQIHDTKTKNTTNVAHFNTKKLPGAHRFIIPQHNMVAICRLCTEKHMHHKQWWE